MTIRTCFVGMIFAALAVNCFVGMASVVAKRRDDSVAKQLVNAVNSVAAKSDNASDYQELVNKVLKFQQPSAGLCLYI